LKDPQIDLSVQTAIHQALQGQREQAIISFQDYLKDNPSDTTAQAALAATLLNGNPSSTKYSEERTQAITLLKQVVNQTPYLSAYEQLIRVALDDNRLTDAESFLEKAELLNTRNSSLLFLRGRLSEMQNNLDMAQDSYQKCLEQAPYLTEAHYRLAQVALKSGKLDMAQWELEQLLQNVPDDGRALKLLAFLDQRQEKNGQALALYMKALQPDVLLNTARLLAKQGDTAKAASILSSVESLAVGNPDLLFNVGMTYADLHNVGKAKSVLTHFIQSQGSNQDARIPQAKEALKKLGH
jgi:tetratricopeptide (TPR) repeat protein